MGQRGVLEMGQSGGRIESNTYSNNDSIFSKIREERGFKPASENLKGLMDYSIRSPHTIFLICRLSKKADLLRYYMRRGKLLLMMMTCLLGSC